MYFHNKLLLYCIVLYWLSHHGICAIISLQVISHVKASYTPSGTSPSKKTTQASKVRVSISLWKLISVDSIFLVVPLESSSNKDGDGYENVTQRVNSRNFKLYRAYSNSFNLSNVGRFFWSWILKDCIKVQEEKMKVVVLCSRPRQIVKLSTFTL